jgi:hypothetical protein
MAVVEDFGDESRGETIVCVCRKIGRPELVHATIGHKGMRFWIKGLPARAIVERPFKLL